MLSGCSTHLLVLALRLDAVRVHGRSVTEIWGRDEMKNADLWGGDETQNWELLGDETSNRVMYAQKA